MIVLSTQIKVVSRFCESAIFNTQILWKKTWKIHGKQKQFIVYSNLVLFPKKKQSCTLFARHFSKICMFFLHFILGPFFKGSAPPPRVLVANQPVTSSPRLQRTGHPSSGGHESLACGRRLARGGTRGTQLWCADLGECLDGVVRKRKRSKPVVVGFFC